MRRLMLLCLPAVLLLPDLASAQCAGTEAALAPCHCLTMLPFPPVEEECVTIAHYVNGVQQPIGPLEEPICIANGDEEICLGEDDVAFNDDGSVTMLWTGDLADILAEGGWWFWVWSDPGFPDGDLAEVLMADLADDGVGCSSCAGACDTPPVAEGAPIFEECPEPDEGGEGGEGGDNNCESDGPIEPSHCLTMSPNPPVEDEPVTIALIIEGEQVQITPEEPICFAPDELCLFVEDGDVELNDDGSITFIWTGDMQDRVEEGWAWVWNEEFELLAEVSLAVLAENGEGCSTCAIPPVEVPATGFLGLALLALLSALVGALSLRRRTA